MLGVQGFRNHAAVTRSDSVLTGRVYTFLVCPDALRRLHSRPAPMRVIAMYKSYVGLDARACCNLGCKIHP